MKIIKQFNDFEFTQKVNNFYRYSPPIETFIWILGDDGEIYYVSIDYGHNHKGYIVSLSRGQIQKLVSFATMKKIVKEFGHLTPFI